MIGAQPLTFAGNPQRVKAGNGAFGARFAKTQSKLESEFSS